MRQSVAISELNIYKIFEILLRNRTYYDFAELFLNRTDGNVIENILNDSYDKALRPDSGK